MLLERIDEDETSTEEESGAVFVLFLNLKFVNLRRKSMGFALKTMYPIALKTMYSGLKMMDFAF